MPHGRMQHTAALPHSKRCLAYASSAIASTFFADLFQVIKTVERDRRTWCDFFFKLADTILKPLIHQMPRSFFWWDRQFADRIFRPRSIEQHADATYKYTCGMAQLLSRGLAALRRCVPRGIVWTYLKVYILELFAAYGKIVKFLQENVTIFNRKIVSFPIKIVKFCCRNR